MKTDLWGLVDTLVKWAKGPAQARLTGFRSLAVAQAEPAWLELSRSGRLFVAGTTAVASARAPVQDLPTTTANWLLFNPLSSNRTLAILQAGAFLGSGTADTGQAGRRSAADRERGRARHRLPARPGREPGLSGRRRHGAEHGGVYRRGSVRRRGQLAQPGEHDAWQRRGWSGPRRHPGATWPRLPPRRDLGRRHNCEVHD